MRKSLYSRIGVIKGSTTVDSKKPVDQDDDKCSISSEETTTSSDTDLRSFVLKDLFSQLLLAHSSDSPWECLLHTSLEIKNPVLSILAASYHDSPFESCFFLWLYTSLIQDELLLKNLEATFPPKNIASPSTDDIEKLILLAVQSKKILILFEGVICFLPTTPLVPLMEFLKNFVLYKRFDSSIENFQNQLWDYNKNLESPSVLHSLLWIENISVSILKEAVISCSTSYERLILLRHYSHTRLEKSFSTEVTVPPFIKVCQMLQHLGNTSKHVDIKPFLLPETDAKYKTACWDAIKKLLKLHLYNDARLFSGVAKLPLEEMIMLQINQESEEARNSDNWGKLGYRIEFWSQTIQKLSSSTVPLHSVIDFLEVQCEISNMYGEKYFLMKSVIEYLNHVNEKTGINDVKAYNIEVLKKKMWWFCIKTEVNGELLPEIFDIVTLHEFDVEDLKNNSEKSSVSHFVEDEKEKKALGNIIRYFLSNKDVQRAFELSITFGYECPDLKLIKTCLQLANNEIDVTAVDLSMPDCALEIASSRIIKSLVLWVSSRWPGITAAQRDVIQCMEEMSRKSSIAVIICHQILVHYTIATILTRNYCAISKEKDPFLTLKHILVKKLSDDFVLARSFILVHELADKDIAKFLSKEIWDSLQMLSGTDAGIIVPEEKSAFSENLIYDPLRTNEGFQLIVKLCQDSSILGNALMDIFSEEGVDLSAKSSDKCFSSIVELCICAHECYTAACNMEGISKILHNAQLLVNILEEAKKYNIMIRLLTGLGRYSEMMYVFDVLKSHDKFSLLFEKKIDSMPGLRLSLQDYLKRWSPAESDNYFYSLASKFGMHREKAELLEMSVQKTLSQLCKRNMDNDLKEELENAVQFLSDAAKSYCKADCFNQAQHCAKLARLVALQIYFLPSGIWIIGLDDASVSRFITEHDNFSQSLIVAEEYHNDRSWEQALLNNVVIRGDRGYLREFKANLGLKASTILSVARKFQSIVSKTENAMRNMKYLLTLCSDIKTKYCLAKELGFSDIASELRMGEGSSYLRDLYPEESL